MSEIENINTQIMNNKTDAQDKIEINLKDLNITDYMAIESIRKIKNPFKMITVKDVMQDLNICETIAYKTFKRNDFPSINIGKTNQVMLIAYLIWKMQKRV